MTDYSKEAFIGKVMAVGSDGSEGVKQGAKGSEAWPVSLATAPALVAGSAVIGGAKDAGPSWTPVQTYTTSADMTTAAAISAAPAAGQKVVADDIMVSTDTAMLFTLQEETSNTVLAARRLAANESAQITLRNGLRVPTADKKLFGKASAAGNLYITVSQHSEV